MVTKNQGRDNKANYFLLLLPIGMVQIHLFKLVTSCRRGEFRDLNLWLLRLATFLSSVECRPLH